jgi:hypothetical protein
MRRSDGLCRAFPAVVAASLVLSACSLFSSDKKDAPPCPRVSVLADAARLTRFRQGPGRDVTDVQLQAEFARYTGSCKYDRDDKKMTISLEVAIDAQRGPAAQGRQAELSYFIAIPTFYPKPEAKVVLPVAITFPDDQDRVRYTDSEIEIVIPIARLADLAQYEVFVGLQLSPDELDYNRRDKGKR